MSDEPTRGRAPDPEEEIFETCLALPVGERAAYLDQVCAGDAALRQRVEELLRSHSLAKSFLEEPPVSVGTGQTIKLDLPLAEKVGDRIGRYKLLQQIGEGGCGVVYMAEQEQPVKRRVALKVIKLGMDTKSVIARFEAERQALAMMDHPNIAKVLDAGATDTGRPYFAMELVRGMKITDYCDKNNLPTRERLLLFVQVCQAIQHAHQKGIIHRDIKPSNILVTLRDGVPVPKVIDFGIAKATTDQRLTDKTLFTAFEQFIGTPTYMSPEQAEMSELGIDTRSDIYSLGVLLYELLTGQTPFDSDLLLRSGLDEIRRIIREQEPVRPSTRLSTMLAGELTTAAQHRQTEPAKLSGLIRGDLDWIVMKCLEKDRARRYETAAGLGADLQRHLTNEPVAARPPSASYRFQKTIRRNKLAFGAGAAVLLALLAGLTFASLGWRQARVQRDRALAAREGEEKQRKAAEANAVIAQEQMRRAEVNEAEMAHLLYVANMNLAQTAWDGNNVGRLRQLLENTATNKEHGFEWYYWQRQAHLEVKTLRGHTGWIESCYFSPDGRRILTASLDQTAKVWDTASGKVLFTLKGHYEAITSAAFSPDGQRIVTSGDPTAEIWDAASGKVLLTLTNGAEILPVTFSPDGRRILTGSKDRTAKVWEAESGKLLLTLSGNNNWITAAAFSPDGRRIVTGSWDGAVKVWDAASGKMLLTLKKAPDVVLSVAFSPDGRRIVTAGGHAAKLWDAANGQELLSLSHGTSIFCAAFSPDGQWIVTGGEDQIATLWDVASGKELHKFKGHGGRIWHVAFSPDGRRIVSGGEDLTAKVWNAIPEEEPVTLRGHSNGVCSVAFSPDGRRILTGSLDHTAKVWDTSGGKQLLTLTNNAVVYSAEFSPDGLRIVTASNDHSAKVWDASSGRQLLTLSGHSDQIFRSAFSPDGRRILTGSYDLTAKVWDAGNGQDLLTLRGHTGIIVSVAFSPDGRRIVTGSHDYTAKVWDAVSGQELLTLRGHSNEVRCAAFSPDGRRIVTGSYDHTGKVWDAASGRELFSLNGHSASINAAAFSPDGQRIVTGSNDQTAKVWEAATGLELLTLKGHNDILASVAFSPDGQRIVTGSLDHTAKVWEAATTQQATAWQREEKP
jgi:eukaryotic-like serine/threonine-protein kinase